MNRREFLWSDYALCGIMLLLGQNDTTDSVLSEAQNDIL